MSDTILSTKSLVMAFGGFRAIDGVDLSVRRGNIHAVIGPNGAGKTTLFHCLTGELKPTAGTVLFDDREVSRLPAHGRVGIGMGRSFQITSVFQGLSVRENLRVAAQGRDGSRALAFWRPAEKRRRHTERAEEILERLELGPRAELPAGELSHGQQRVLEVGMALAAEPQMLLLDEPTSGMGIDDIPVMTRLISELGQEHTIMLIEHNMSIVMSISDTITVMHQGRILVEGAPEEIRTDERVRTAYLGEAA